MATVEVETPGGVFKFQAEPSGLFRNPKPGERIPVYLCSDGRVTANRADGLQEIGELASIADDGVVVRVYRSSMSVELQETLAGPHLLFSKA